MQLSLQNTPIYNKSCQANDDRLSWISRESKIQAQGICTTESLF